MMKERPLTKEKLKSINIRELYYQQKSGDVSKSLKVGDTFKVSPTFNDFDTRPMKNKKSVAK